MWGPAGGPGEFSPAPSPAPPPRLPNLTSPNHHQGPYPRPAEHPQKPPKLRVGAPTSSRPSPSPDSCTLLLKVTVNRQPGRAQGHDNKIHRSSVTIGNVTQIRPFLGPFVTGVTGCAVPVTPVTRHVSTVQRAATPVTGV